MGVEIFVELYASTRLLLNSLYLSCSLCNLCNTLKGKTVVCYHGYQVSIVTNSIVNLL